MASNASLMVTPRRLRAVTSRPSGKTRSIFLMGGSVSIFLSMSLSSTVEGEEFSFLEGGVSRELRQVRPLELDATAKRRARTQP